MLRCLRATAVVFSLVLHVTVHAFTEGEVCSGLSLTTNSSHLLRGRHLVVNDIVWPPFGEYDTVDHRWSGLDVDLLKLVAQTLNFTYTLGPPIRQPVNQTWAAYATELPSQGDLLLSWWTQLASRQDVVSLLYGHVDVDWVLLVPKPKLVEPSFLETTFTFMEPFTTDLWLLIIGVTIVSSAMLYIVEEYNSTPHEDYAEAEGRWLDGMVISVYLVRCRVNAVSAEHSPCDAM